MSKMAEGYLEVGRNEAHEIVVNHPDLKPDVNGVGHIVFSIDQARNLARLLLTHAAYAEWEGKRPEQGLLAPIKVFAMNDEEWYAAATADEALQAMAEWLCFETTPEGIVAMCKEFGVEGVRELDDEAMDRLRFHDEDGETDEVQNRSFREQLDKMIAEGEEFPCFFASTER